MFNCSFCESVEDDGSWFNHYGLCVECEKIKRLAKIYDIKDIYNTLAQIYIREEKPIQKRTEAVKEGVSLRSGKKCESVKA